jgi:SAM-dependent methyltransferase
MELATKFTEWLMARVRPFLSGTVLEIGSGIGNNVRAMMGQEKVIASESDPEYLHVLQNAFEGRRRIQVVEWDVTQQRPTEIPLVDTVLCSNVLEHIEDESAALANLHSALRPGGRAILVVPFGPMLFGSLDRAMGHHRRYSRESLLHALKAAGFEIEASFSMNKIGVLGWFVSGRLLRRKVLGRAQLKLFNTLVPLIRLLDPVLPWTGLSLVAVAKKPGDLDQKGDS